MQQGVQREIQGNFGPILTQNLQMKEVIRTVSRVASSDCNILINGETGTGKNLLSRAIHNASRRRTQRFVSINCLAIPDTLIESELFGHEKGAFTDAHEQKRGCFESAHNGTIFLDEIGDMSLNAQGKLLQVVEEKRIKRIGSTEVFPCDVRVICATNKDLTKKIDGGQFREDLYFRLKEVTIQLPPLRERKEDILFLIEHFVKCYGEMYNKPKIRISKAAAEILTHYDWPGNFRELKNTIKSAVILCPQDVLWVEHFPFQIRLNHPHSETPPATVPDDSLDAFIKQHLLQVLTTHQWNKRKTARILKISRPRLDRYLEKFGLHAS